MTLFGLVTVTGLSRIDGLDRAHRRGALALVQPSYKPSGAPNCAGPVSGTVLANGVDRDPGTARETLLYSGRTPAWTPWTLVGRPG